MCISENQRINKVLQIKKIYDFFFKINELIKYFTRKKGHFMV